VDVGRWYSENRSCDLPRKAVMMLSFICSSRLVNDCRLSCGHNVHSVYDRFQGACFGIESQGNGHVDCPAKQPFYDTFMPGLLQGSPILQQTAKVFTRLLAFSVWQCQDDDSPVETGYERMIDSGLDETHPPPVTKKSDAQ